MRTANWYVACRRRDGGPWVCLLGPYATKREADAKHDAATTLVFDLFPVEELRRPVFATLKVKTSYSLPGKLMSELQKRGWQ